MFIIHRHCKKSNSGLSGRCPKCIILGAQLWYFPPENDLNSRRSRERRERRRWCCRAQRILIGRLPVAIAPLPIGNSDLSEWPRSIKSRKCVSPKILSGTATDHLNCALCILHCALAVVKLPYKQKIIVSGCPGIP